MQGLGALGGNKCPIHMLSVLKQICGELNPWVSKKRGFHAVIPKAGGVQSVGNLGHQRDSPCTGMLMKRCGGIQSIFKSSGAVAQL